MNIRKILLLSDAFYLASGALLGPIYAVFVNKIGGDIIEAGGSFAVFMLTAGFVVFLLAIWEDKSKHKKKFVIAGYGIGVIGTAGYFFVNSSAVLFIVQALLGLSVALAWGEWEAVDYLALGIGAITGAFIAEKLGFQALFFMMLVMTMFSFVTSLFLIKKEK